MMKINSNGQARNKLRLNTTPDDLRVIANRLEESAKASGYNQTVEIDVTSEPFVISFEFQPVKQHYANTGTCYGSVTSEASLIECDGEVDALVN